MVLVNLQGGLLLGLLEKASILVDYGQADIWVGHRHTSNVDMGSFIPERWLWRLRGLEGVEQVEPYIVMFGQIKMRDGHFENVVVVGSDRASLLGNAWVTVEGDPTTVRQVDGILVDDCDADRLGNPRLGDIREINGQQARVVGMTHGIVSFTTNPYVFTTLERARNRYATGVPPGECSYFLVRTQPGADVAQVVQDIRERVPGLDVYDKRTYSLMCMRYWLTRTGIGISFGLAALLGLLVGLAVVAQTLYAAVTERTKEFATLKALGAGDDDVARFVMAQALANALFGSVLGLASAVAIAALLDTPRAPVRLTWWIGVVSVVLVSGVCLLAAWLPCWSVRRIDPASVLRGS